LTGTEKTGKGKKNGHSLGVTPIGTRGRCARYRWGDKRRRKKRGMGVWNTKIGSEPTSSKERKTGKLEHERKKKTEKRGRYRVKILRPYRKKMQGEKTEGQGGTTDKKSVKKGKEKTTE